MGKTSENPKGHVFTFRADDETARIIRAAAAQHVSVSDFLLQAATVTAMNDTIRARVFDRMGK